MIEGVVIGVLVLDAVRLLVPLLVGELEGVTASHRILARNNNNLSCYT